MKERSAFGSLGTILGAGVLAILHSNGIQSSPHHMVANPREVLDTSTADQNDGVLLQIVSNTGDIGGNLDPVGKPDTCYFAQRGVWFLRSRRIDSRANSPALGTPLQSRTLRLVTNLLSARLNQLIEGRQPVLSLLALSVARHRLRHCKIAPMKKPNEYNKATRGCQAYPGRKTPSVQQFSPFPRASGGLEPMAGARPAGPDPKNLSLRGPVSPLVDWRAA